MHNIDAYGDLTSEERATLLRVLRKEEEVRNQEREFICELKYMMEEIEKTSLTDEEEKIKTNLCSRCSQYFSGFYLIFMPFKQCNTCNKRICKTCISEGTENAPVCTYCDLRKKLRSITGSWFYDQSPGKIKQSESVKSVHMGPIFQQHSISFDSPEVFQPAARSESMENDVILLSVSESTQGDFSESEIVQQDVLEPKIDTPDEKNSPKEKVTESLQPETVIFEEKAEIDIIPVSTSLKTDAFSDSSEKEKIMPEDMVDEQNVPPKQPVIPIEKKEVNEKKVEKTVVSDFADKPIIKEKTTQKEKVEKIIEEKKVEKTEWIELAEKPKTDEKITDEEIKSSLESLGIPFKTGTSIENVIPNGMLHGMVKVEPLNDQFLFKLKVVEAVDLVPLNHSGTISSYVVCQAKSHSTVIFKKKTSTIKDCSAPVWGETFEFTYDSSDLNHLMIFLLVKKPREKKSIKTILKKEEFENLIYGSVRIGNAAYLTNEEIITWIKLNKNLVNNVTDWVEFRIHLNKIATPQTLSTHNLGESSSTLTVSDTNLHKEPSTSSLEDTVSLFSISTGYCGQGKICGMLNIYLKYAENNRCLTVKVLNAEGLNLPLKLGNSTKIFATCKLVPKSPNNEKKVTVKSKDINRPELNSTFLLIVDPKQINDTYVIVDLYRTEKILSKVFLGQVSIPFASVLCDKPTEIAEGFSNSYYLSKPIPNALYGFLGTISVSIRYEPPTIDPRFGKLEVRVLKGNQITFNRKYEPIETMVSCALLPDSDPKSIKRTKLFKKSNNPEWKYCISYPEVSFNDLQMYRALEIIIWTNNSAFVGGTRIGPRQTEYSSEIWQDSNKIESDLWEEMIKKPKAWVFATIPLRYCMLSQILYPSLNTNVLNLFNASMAKGARLFFDIMYSTAKKPFFRVYLQSVEGLSIEYEKIYCKILIYSKGVVEKSLIKYVESINDHEWNNRLEIDIPGAVETSAIEFRIKSHITSQEVLKNGGVIFGRVLLSKADSTNEWNLPCPEEIEFFNKLIKSPNTDFSAQLPINVYSKPKKIKRKTTNKRLSILKAEAKNNDKKLVKAESIVEPDEKPRLYSLKKVKPVFRRMTTFDSEKSTKDNETVALRSAARKNIRSFDEFTLPELTEVDSEKPEVTRKSIFIAETSEINVVKVDTDIKDAEAAKIPLPTETLTVESKMETCRVEVLSSVPPDTGVSLSDESPMTVVKLQTEEKLQPVTTSPPETTTTLVGKNQKISPAPSEEIKPFEAVIVESDEKDTITSEILSIQQKEQDIQETTLSSLETKSSEESPKAEITNHQPAIKIPTEESFQDQEEKIPSFAQKTSETTPEPVELIKAPKISEEETDYKSVSDIVITGNREELEPYKLKHQETKVPEQIPILEQSVSLDKEPILKQEIEILQEKIESPSEIEKTQSKESIQSKSVQESKSESISDINLSTKTSDENISESGQKEGSKIKTKKTTRFSRVLKGLREKSIDASDASSQDVKSRRSGNIGNRASIISTSNKSLTDVSDTVSIMTGTEISGKILIRLEYKTSDCVLNITLKDGRGITPHDPRKNKNDTFARINIFPDKSKNAEFKTKVIKGTLDPTWNESFQYSVNENDIKLRKIVINVYHKAFSKNTFLGQIIIHMDKICDKLKKESAIENWYDLFEKVKLIEKSTENLNTLGNLEIKITLTNITQSSSKKKAGPDTILQIKELKASNVCLSQTIPKAICKIYLLSDKSQQDKKSTKPVENISGTFTFNEVIEYNVQKEKLPDCGILIKMCDSKKTTTAFATAKLNNGLKKFSWQDADEQGAQVWQQIVSINNVTKDFKLPLKPAD